MAIHFETDGALTVHAAAENTLITGESMDAILGGAVEATFGVAIGLCLVESLEAVAAFCQELAFAEWDKDNIHTTMSELKTQIHGELARVTQAHFSATDQYLSAVNTDAKAAEDHTKLRASETKVVADKVDACATKEEVTAAKDKAIGAATRAIGANTTTMASKIEKIGQKTTTAGEKIDLIGQVVKSAAEKTDSVAVKMNLVAEHTQLATLITKL